MFRIRRIILLFFGLIYSSPLCGAICHLKKPQGSQAQEFLNRLQPLFGETFTDTYHDEKEGDNYSFTLRICEGVQIPGKFHSSFVGVAQEDKTGKIRNIGSINETIVKGGTDWIMLTYGKGEAYHNHCSQQERQAHIMIVCDPYEMKGKMKVLYEEYDLNENSGCFYMLELPSKVACSSPPTSLSSGSIFLIVFFSVTVVYLLFGALYKRCVYGSKGVDQIPNIGFWKTCGSLQADGCNYLCRCTGSGYNSNQPYQGVADDQLDEEIDDEHLLPM